MTTSRRNLIQALAAGGAALATARGATQRYGPRPAPASAAARLRRAQLAGARAESRQCRASGGRGAQNSLARALCRHGSVRRRLDLSREPARVQRFPDHAAPTATRRRQGHRPAHDAAGSHAAAAGVHLPDRRQGNFHVKAELPNAAGTGMAGSLFVASGASNRPMEEIAKATTGPKWFQIYMNRDMELNRWLVQRAKAAGYSAIVLTADALGPGQSDDYIALGRPRDPALTAGNHDPALGGHGNFSDQKRDLSFSDITFLREASGLPVLVKGVVQPDDIRESLAEGAAGDLGLQSRRPSDGRRPGFDQHAARGGRCGRRPRAGDLGQRHPARHRCVQGAVARRDGGRHRPAGAVGPDRRRLARRQKRLRAAGVRAEVHHADVGRRQGDRISSATISPGHDVLRPPQFARQIRLSNCTRGLRAQISAFFMNAGGRSSSITSASGLKTLKWWRPAAVQNTMWVSTGGQPGTPQATSDTMMVTSSVSVKRGAGPVAHAVERRAVRGLSRQRMRIRRARPVQGIRPYITW